MEINNLTHKFKNFLIANNYSDSTVRSYSDTIKKLAEFLGDRELTDDTIIEYILEIKEKLAPKTISCHLDGLQSFINYTKLNLTIPKRPKIVDKVPKYFDYKFFRDSIIPMVELVSNKPLRDKVLLYFLFFTGIRKGELVKIKRADFNLEERTVKIYMEKVQKERITFYTVKVRNMIKNYFLFEEEKNNAFNIGVNTVSTLLSKLNPYFEKVNLHPHLIRSSFAVHLLQKGVDISVISSLLGHSNIQSTLRYAKLKNTDIHNIYDKYIK